MSFWYEKQAKKLFQELPFYNTFIKKPSIKHLSNMELLHELPFFNELSVVEISKHFKDMQEALKLR